PTGLRRPSLGVADRSGGPGLDEDPETARCAVQPGPLRHPLDHRRRQFSPVARLGPVYPLFAHAVGTPQGFPQTRLGGGKRASRTRGQAWPPNLAETVAPLRHPTRRLEGDLASAATPG